MIRIGVIGYGYWGPNIVRNFNSIEGANVKAVSDTREDSLKIVKSKFPDIECYKNPQDVLRSGSIDVIAVVTPVSTHYKLAKEALNNGKHIFVEKPFTESVAQSKELIEIAEKKGLQIMVDHTFLFTGSVRKIKDIVDQDTLGKLYYYDSTRVNLGLFQHDVNVIWDLAPHDFSIMDYVVKEKPSSVVTTGMGHVSPMENIAYITVYFQSNLIAHFNVNWLSPVKVRKTLIGGEKKMLVWNDVDPDEKIKIYDKGVDVTSRESIYKLLVSYRSGDMAAPRVDQTEALKLECNYFIDCLNNNETPINDGKQGLSVVKLLEACNKSLRNNNSMIKL